jgi:DNA-binding XRE family transcriptional regulator
MHFKNGRHLAVARAMAGLTQLQLAQLAGVHVNGIKRLERMDDRLKRRHHILQKRRIEFLEQ